MSGVRVSNDLVIDPIRLLTAVSVSLLPLTDRRWLAAPRLGPVKPDRPGGHTAWTPVSSGGFGGSGGPQRQRTAAYASAPT